MRVRIDATRCEGHGRCWDNAPELFDSDESGRGVVIDENVPPELESRAHAAASACPERAVILEG